MFRALLLSLSFALTLAAQEPPKPEAPPASPATAIPAPTTASAATTPVAPAPAPTKLDDNLLDPAWFGGSLTFQKAEEADFYWFKPGLDLAGKVLEFAPWDDPAFLKPGRDAKDKERAQKLTDSFPGLLLRGLEPALNGKLKTSRKEGDFLLVGRVVDANAKSTAARFFAPAAIGAGESATMDLKILDAKTKEVVAAFHHRVVSATVMSTIDSKLGKWFKAFGPFLAIHAFGTPAK